MSLILIAPKEVGTLPYRMMVDGTVLLSRSAEEEKAGTLACSHSDHSNTVVEGEVP